jgi:hypothetical protein
MLIKHPAMNVIEITDETLPGTVVITNNSILFWRDLKNDDMYIGKRENSRYVRDYTVSDCHALLEELRDHLARREFYGKDYDDFIDDDTDLFSRAAQAAVDITEIGEDE